MKRSHLLFALLLLAVGGAAGWFLRDRKAEPSDPAQSGRKILFYQSAMHPWIKSDKPGRCTICGMELTPVFEGEKGIEEGKDLIRLDPSSVQVVDIRTQPVIRSNLVKTLKLSGTIEDDET